MAPAELLDPQPGERVLDLCAAPGGKSTQLAGKLLGKGLLVCNEINAKRAKILSGNMERLGISNALVLNEHPKKLTERFAGYFDKILVDAPCSGEGMFRKDNKLIKSWEKNGPEFYSKIQRDIVLSGADMLKPGGKMLYSTCTFSKLEDEETIRHLLRERPEMQLIPIPSYEGFCPGIIENEEDTAMQIEKCVRIFPHKMQGEGHFLALLEKDTDASENYHAKRKPSTEKLPEELLEFLSHVTFPVQKQDIFIRDSKVYQVSPEMPQEGGLRIMRNGLLLGEMKKNRFEPSQALAMALQMSEYDKIINLPASDERVVKYLKGETLDFENENDYQDGWNLFCVDGYPLGWGKYSKGALKNKYLAGWRWQ